MRFAKLLKKVIEIEEKIEDLVTDKEALFSQLETIRTEENTVDALEEILQEEKYNNMIQEIQKITKEIDRLYKLKIDTVKASYEFYQNCFQNKKEA